MLHWQDEALILKVDAYGDHDAIVQVFSPAHGACRGVVKAGLSSKRRADMQPGTLASINFKARMPEHMGSITLEAQHSFAARVMHDPLKLAGVGSILALLAASLAEHDPHPELYARTIAFLKHAAVGDEQLIWLSEYIRLELALLEEVGFGLDLSSCAATGVREGLCYVSPKSARAVSEEAGKPYADKLLPLPAFLMESDGLPGDFAEVALGLRLTGHFIDTRLLPALHRNNPPLRQHFVDVLSRRLAAA